MINLIRQVLRRSARAILLTVAVLYFLIDLIFLSPDFPVSGTSAAAAHYDAEVGQKITRLGG
jgi:hypothetical protein